MDLLADPAFKLKYQKYKYKVKVWESDFCKANGRNPSKNDIRAATSQVRDAYKMYYKLKTLVLNDTLMELTFLDECVENDIPNPKISDSNVKFEETIQNEKPVRAVLKDKALNVDDNITPKDQTICDNNSLKIDLKDSSNVWGKHLNKDLHNKTKSHEKKKTHLKSSSFNLSRKLFSGSAFNKRNPRKSLSFSHSNQETSVPSPSTFSESSQASFDSEVLSSQPLEFNQSETEESCSTNVSNDFVTSSTRISESAVVTSFDVKVQYISPTPTLVTGGFNFQNSFSQNVSTLVSDKGSERLPTHMKMHNSTPISAMQRFLDSENHGPTFSKKTLNKGWLERCTKLNVHNKDSSCTNMSVESHEITLDSRTPCNFDITNHTHSSRTVESDEDLIYSSGDERQTKSQEYKFSFKRKFSYEVKNSVMDTMSASVEPPTSYKRPKYLRKSHSEAEIKLSTVSDNISAPENLDIALAPQLDIEKLADAVMRNENSLNNKGGKPKRKSKLTKKDVLEKKMESGLANENFVKIDLKKKIYARGKKKMTFTKYKKAEWKKKKKGSAVYDGPSKELSTCFKCGDIGHWAGECKYTGDKLLPQEDESVIEESQFPTLEEVEAMCSEPLHAVKRMTTQPLVSQNTVILDPNNPGQAEVLDCDQIICSSVEPLYKLKADGSLIDTPREVYDALTLFGYESFRPGQEEAVMRVLSGLSTLVTLSTGSGKSLVYQLSAYLMAQKSPCITIVVSPLVSLMEDQVVGVASCLKAACLHTNQTPKQRLQVMEQAKSGNLHILLVSPEAVVSGEKASGFGSILKELPAIGFACIDEAHCVSQWSHNFRPSYLVICKVLREKLGVKTVLGLTATATKETCDSIVKHLDIPDGLNGVIKDVPLPDNLVLSVSKDENRDRALISLLQGERFKDFNSIIVYCTRQAECERIAAFIRTCLQDTKLPPSTAKKSSLSRNCEPYHAGLSASKRKQIQKAFMAGNLRIVVATVAFGMGINKADIRAVIHYNMPRNFESYVQEVGRAGRDGLPAHCHLFLDSRGGDQCELRRHIYADSVDRHTIRKLLQRVFVPCKCVQLTELLDGVELSERFEDESTPLCGTDEPGNCTKTVQACKRLKVQCPGHEVAFDIDETVRALDLPKENISTMLCYLELHSRRWIKLMSPVYIVCKVMSYRGTKALKEAAKLSPPLAMAIALDQRRGISHEKSNHIEFPIVDIAALIGWDSGMVKHHLKNLEWKKDGEKWRRTSLTVEFTVLGFRVKAPGNLAPRELDNALDSLFDRVNSQENKALLQLQTVFKSLTSVAYPHFSACCNVADVGRSDDLKKQIREYFEQDGSKAVLEVEASLSNEDQVASEVRSLVCGYRDQTFTGRAVARIFHGISSPCFPAMVWSKNRYWRAHLGADFRLLCAVATREILRLR